MDYKKSYAAVGGADCRIRPDAHRRVSGDWMAAVAGSGGCYGGCSPDAAVLPVSVLRRTLGSPGRHSPLLPGVWGVHSVKILSYWQNKAALQMQSGFAAVWNKRQCVLFLLTLPWGRQLPEPCPPRWRHTWRSSSQSERPDPWLWYPTRRRPRRCPGGPGWRGPHREERWAPQS